MILKNTLKITGISLLGFLGVGLCVISNPVHMHIIGENYAMCSAVEYNDNNNVIVFLDDDYDTEFNHLSSYLNNLYEELGFSDFFTAFNDTHMETDDYHYTVFDTDSLDDNFNYFGYYNLNGEDARIGYIGLNYWDYDDNKIICLSSNDDFDTTTEIVWDYIEWHLTADLYSGIKSAIQQDLLPPHDTTFFVGILGEIIAILTGGITGIASGVGSGVSTLVSDIFIHTNALSVFGGILVVFAGISLAIGLSRWIMNFLTSLGAKK